ncbi:MAG: class I SAM-dependent methyltransferase [Pseudanabaenaceae cyanobacterium]
MGPILITGADSKFFALVRGTILSIRDKPQGANIPLGFLDLGCTPEQLAWVRSQGAQIVIPQWEFDFPNRENTPNYLKGLLVRPFFRKYFPGYELYLWIDADAWVQDWRAIELFFQGARRRQGLAIVPEVHGPNDFVSLAGKIPAVLGYGRHLYREVFDEDTANLYHIYPLLNAGVFCLHREALHWEIWASHLYQAAQKEVTVMTDRMALHLTVFAGTVPTEIQLPPIITEIYLRTEFLPGWCNFLIGSHLPSWDETQAAFVERYLPHQKLGIVHNTGSNKLQRDRMTVPTVQGTAVEVSLYYPVLPDRNTLEIGLSTQEKNMDETMKLPVTVRPSGRLNLPKGDYIAPGLQTVFPDAAFPNKVIGDTQGCGWPYLRREIPHNWYVDRRHPYVGFLSRDEAHILYNNALLFRGKPALEVGCWMGWSAVHLVLAGVHLDIIDPLLEKAEARQSVESSLEAARSEFPEFGSYVLHPGYSPQKVEELGQAGKTWSLIFIDGNHDRPAPLADAQACVKYAAADAMILFHDLASPEVTEGLDFLRCNGWNVMVYQTMQIMGVAWRGNVQPVRHVPDPTVNWTVPEHLRPYPICGTPEEREFRELAAQVQPYTLLQDCRLYSLYRLTREICEQDRPGNIVECGSYKGGAAALMAAVVKRYSRRSRQVFACDTFAGMPEPTDVDRHLGVPANDTGFGVGTLAAPVTENLTKICEQLGVSDLVVPVVGLFAETLPQFRSQMEDIALLHADGDWYESTRDIFQHLYGAVLPGGVVQIDHYGHWEGCRQAVEEFATGRGETWDLQPIDYTGVFFYKPQVRDFRSALQPPLLNSIQRGSLQYSYRGVRMVKNPFDFALYPLLLWQQQPKTLIEVGSFCGGSALWFADLMTTYGIEGRVYSVDINWVTAVSHPKVTFLQGDQTQLEKVFGPEFWQTVARPLLVIEDGAHFYETSKAVLDFFQPHLQPGEYIVIEDGIVDDLGETQVYRGGPNRAIQEFLAEWGEYYEIDTAFCDFFGHNVTWNTNGYLRKVKATPTLAEKLGLRQRNLVIFPDWSQFEEAVYEQLQEVWRAILSHPQCGETALLIGTIGEDPAVCDEMVSSAAMELLALEDFDFDREPQVIFAHQLTTAQWQELRSQLTGRLVLESEVSLPAVLADLPALTL